MEKKKSKKGVITIIILVLLVLSLVGYIFYNKNESEKQTTKLENEVKTLKSENTNLKTTITTIEKNSKLEKENTTENTNYINAIYWGSKDDNSESSEVVLFSNGKCLSLVVNSEYNLGTYKIENNQLILTLSQYDETVNVVYNISDNYETIKSPNSSYSLKKINE